MTKSKTERVAKLCGVGGFNDDTAPHVNTFYQAADGGGAPDGSDTMSRIIVFSPAHLLLPSGEFIFCETGNINNDDGWYISWNTLSQFTFAISDSIGDVQTVTLEPTKKLKRNEVYVLFCSYDGTHLLLRLKGETSDANLGAAKGYTASTKKLTIGARDYTSEIPAKSFIIHAYLATDSKALSLSEMAAIEAQIIEYMEQGRDLLNAPLLADMEHFWSADDVVIGPGPLAVTWPDRIGSSDLVKVGEPQGFGVRARF